MRTPRPLPPSSENATTKLPSRRQAEGARGAKADSKHEGAASPGGSNLAIRVYVRRGPLFRAAVFAQLLVTSFSTRTQVPVGRATKRQDLVQGPLRLPAVFSRCLAFPSAVLAYLLLLVFNSLFPPPSLFHPVGWVIVRALVFGGRVLLGPVRLRTIFPARCSSTFPT